MTQLFILSHSEARKRAADAVLKAPEGYAVRVGESTRTLDQNAAQWPILQAFSQQMEWPVNGRMEKLTPEEWKDVLSAAFDGEIQPRISPGLNGGMVMVGRRTREFGKRKFSEWIEFLHATAAERGVNIEQREPVEA